MPMLGRERLFGKTERDLHADVLTGIARQKLY